MLGHVRRLHRVHLLGAALRGPDGEDARASAHVEHHLVLELARVEANGVVVGGHARLILEHVLLVIEVAVGAEVVGEVGVSDLVGLHDDHVGVGGFGAGHGGGRAGRLAGSAAENGGAEASAEEARSGGGRAERRSRGEREARASVSASKQGSGLWTIAPAEKAAGRRLCGKTATRSRSRRGFARAGLGRTDARGAASHPREERVKSSCVRGAESARAVQSWPAPRGRRRKPPRAFSRERRRGGREGRFWRFWRRYQRNTSARSIAPSRVLSRAPPRLRHVSRARFEPISTRRGSTRRERRSRCSP